MSVERSGKSAVVSPYENHASFRGSFADGSRGALRGAPAPAPSGRRVGPYHNDEENEPDWAAASDAATD